MGFFSRRRKRESALASSAGEQPLGSFAQSEDQAVVGQQVGGGQPAAIDFQGLGAADGLAALAQLGPMIQQAVQSGNVQISQGQPAVIDMRGSGLREEIIGIMAQHGIDPSSGTANANVDVNASAEMQQQIFAALAKHGVGSQTGWSTGAAQAQPPEGEQPQQ